MANYPFNRASQEYRAGQLGIQGTSADAYVGEGGKNFYIGRQSTRDVAASDDHDGTDPREPMATLQGLIDRTAAITAATGTRQPYLREHDTIFIQTDISESVITGDTTDMPAHISIVGVGTDEWSPAWSTDVVGNPCLTLRCLGWTVQGIKFLPGSASSGVRLELVAASNYNASRCTIKDCHFDGAYTGLYGIELVGAPYDLLIKGNEFRELTAAGNAYAICIISTSFAHPYMCKIVDNIFWENENHVGSFDQNRTFNLCIFKGNIFHEGEGISATLILDLRGGASGHNTVIGNFFGGDYSNVGGYYDNVGTAGNWVGNYAEDVGEAEVGDNGITVAPPA
jgi:hypothetical protein